MKMQLMITAAAFLFLPLGAQEKKDTSTLPVPDPINLKVLKVATGAELGPIMRIPWARAVATIARRRKPAWALGASASRA